MGVHKKISTPDEMWELFINYISFCEENPVKKHVFVGKDGDSAHQVIERPLTYEGFCNYLEDEGVITTVDHYFINWEGRYGDFVAICTRIKRVIRQHQIENGLAGIYNPSITQRLNGLVEKTENVNVEEPPFDYSQLSDAALEEIRKATKRKSG